MRPASAGVGPLIQRDYWAVIDGCALTPLEVAQVIASRFCDFPPPQYGRFERAAGAEGELVVGERLRVLIEVRGEAAVAVLHRAPGSLTLGTLEPHPEAGRITFGAYPNDRGDVIFHIRSRARSASALDYLGFRMVGDAMQTCMWTDFIDRLAHDVGVGVHGSIHADSVELDAETERADDATGPTFVVDPT